MKFKSVNKKEIICKRKNIHKEVAIHLHWWEIIIIVIAYDIHTTK